MTRDFDGLLIEDTPGNAGLIVEWLRVTEEPVEWIGVDERSDNGF